MVKTSEIDVLKSICREIEAEGRAANDHLTRLSEAFGTRFTKAWEAIKEGRVKKYIFKPSARIVWIVVGKERDYLVMPDVEYCSCLPSFEKMLVLIHKRPYLRDIGSLVEEELKLSKPKKLGHILWAKAKRNLEAISFDPMTFKVKVCPITRVLKRQSDGWILQIKTEDGRLFFVSSDHPVVIVNENGFHAKLARDLEVNKEFIPVIKRLPLDQSNEGSFDLIEECLIRGLSSIRVQNAKMLLYEDGRPAIARRIGVNINMIEHWRRGNAIPLMAYLKLERDITIRENLRLTAGQGSRYEIPAVIRIDKNLARLIGYYLAKGHISKYRVVLSFNATEIDICREVQKLLKECFNVRSQLFPDKKWKTIRVLANSKLLSIFFNDILNLGCDSHTKRLPDFIFSIPKDIISELLDAYFIGDGTAGYNVNKKSVVVRCSTASENLAYGLQYALLKLGINTVILKRRLYELYIQSGNSISSFIEQCGSIVRRRGLTYTKGRSYPLPVSECIPAFVIKSSQDKYVKYQQKKSRVGVHFLDEKSAFHHLKEGDIHIVKIIDIKRIPYKGALYDVSISNPPMPCFMQGFGVFTHNCDDFYFRFDTGHLCYHIIAQKMAEAIGQFDSFEDDDSFYEVLMREWKAVEIRVSKKYQRKRGLK